MATPGNIFKYLRDTDGAGSADANVDGSVTPVDFVFLAGSRCVLEVLERLIVGGSGAGSMASSSYVTLTTLTNGIEIEHRNARGDVLDLLDGEPITSNSVWAQVCYDATEVSFSGGGNKALSVRWTWGRSGKPLPLGAGDRVIARVSDDLSALTRHRFQVQGHYL